MKPNYDIAIPQTNQRGVKSTQLYTHYSVNEIETHSLNSSNLRGTDSA